MRENEFARFLKRHRPPLTQVALSRLSNVSATCISGMENSTHLPSNIQHVLAILRSLDLTRSEFIEGIRAAAYDVNLFSIPVFKGTNPVGMDAVEYFAENYHNAYSASSKMG